MNEFSVIAGRFVVEAEVASGGMGRILRARDLAAASALVAIKIVTTDDANGLARFERECESLARISHPQVVSYIAHGVDAEGRPWLAMEWLEGHDLREALDRKRARRARSITLQAPELASSAASADEATTLSIAEVVMLGRGVASALAALHAAGVVHRDVKPSNVFLVDGDFARPKLLDLGVVRVGDNVGARLTQTGTLIGTPFYMAPEQAREDAELGPSVDVFALGSVLYECLAGVAPFAADALATVLVRIMFLEPASILEHRSDVPEALIWALEAMLQKAAPERTADGAEALALLEAVAVTPSETLASSGRTRVARHLTHAERRILYALLVRNPSQAPHDGASLLERARAIVELTGTQSAPLLDGSVVVVADSQATPTEAASRLTRAGLSLLRADPKLALVLRAERAELAREGREAVALGLASEGADGAAHHASTTPTVAQGREVAGELRVDKTTAALLESRFELARENGVIRVVRQRPHESLRTLLGRPTKTVGRRLDLALLTATWDECEGESMARAVLVTAPAGAGKTRLVHEFLRTLSARGTPFQVLHGQGDPISAATPFMLFGSALRRAAGLAESGALTPERERALLDAFIAQSLSDAPTRARHLPLLGVLAGVPFDDASSEVLRAARGDPDLMSEAVRAATCAWLNTLASTRPVLLVLEDLHWGDLPSVRLADAVLGTLAERPLCVLALARPEVKTRFPNPFPGKPLMEHRLDPLPPRAATELVKQCLPDAADNVVAAMVQRAEGHAFHLEELIRLVAEGGADAVHGTLPESVLAMAQARLDAVGADGKRVLRAASVFGVAFSREGVECVLEAGGAPRASTAKWLRELTDRELIVPAQELRVVGRHEHRFRQALVRDAAYASLTHVDRERAHLLAGAWLERVGVNDPVALALHFREGRDAERAVHWLTRAAEAALQGGDPETALAYTEEAERTGAEGVAAGRILALRAIATQWSSRYADSIAAAERALELLTPGSAWWYEVAGCALTSCTRSGAVEVFDRLRLRIADATPSAAVAESERVDYLARLAFSFCLLGRLGAADPVLDALPAGAALEDDLRIDPRTKAMLYTTRSLRSGFAGDVGNSVLMHERTVAWYERAGDTRNVIGETSTLGRLYGEIGLFDEAARLLRPNLARARELRTKATITYAAHCLGTVLAQSQSEAAHDEARELLRSVIDDTCAVPNRRIEGWARSHLAGLELACGRPTEAEEHARIAETLLKPFPVLHPLALATHARALAALCQPDAALTQARQALSVLAGLPGLPYAESLAALSLVACLRASGLHAEADAATRDAMALLERRVAQLPRPEWQASFLALPLSRATLALPS